MASDMFEKLMAKKGESDMEPSYKKAKMSTLKALHDEMGKMLAEDVGGFKKVTVAAPDKDGLAKGLDKAKELMGEEMMGEEESEEDAEEESPEALEAKIAELKAKLEAKKLKI